MVALHGEVTSADEKARAEEARTHAGDRSGSRIRVHGAGAY